MLGYQNLFASSSVTRLVQKTIADEFGSLSINRPTTSTREYIGPRLETLQRVSTTDVVKLVDKMPSKSSPRDVLPTSLLRSCTDVFAPVIAHLANLSFASGQFPSIYKTAQVLPLLKKQGLDHSNPVNYRPISNLSTISKIIERLALSQLRPHLLASKNFNPLQSGYRPAHSTETALLRILDSCYSAMDNKRQTALISLDISAAFDTINHRVLLERLSSDFGVDGVALVWLRSYLLDRQQFVKLGSHCSATVRCSSGVPQGSVLGPLLFAVYVSPVGDLISSHDVDHHQYADDTQLFLSMSASNLHTELHRLELCSLEVKAWFLENDLLLNADKSDVMFIGTSAQLSASSSLSSVTVAGENLVPTSELKSLGVVLDNRLTFNAHVTAVCRACNYHIWALRHIRHLLPLEVAKMLACSIVGSRLDYCNSLMYGAPTSSLSKLQRAQNTLARVVLQQPRRTHAKPLLQTLHWLPIEQRIQYKLALLTFKARMSASPTYLVSLLSEHKTTSSMTLRSASNLTLNVPRTRTECGKRAFRVGAPTIYNNLPADVLSSDSVLTFKKRLKTILFVRAFAV